MALYLGQRLHVFLNGLGGRSDEAELKELHHRLEEQFRMHGLLRSEGRADLVRILARSAMEAFELDPTHHQYAKVERFIVDLLDYEGAFVLPACDQGHKRSTSQTWELRDLTLRQLSLIEEFDATCETYRIYACTVFEALWRSCPALLTDDESDKVSIPGDLISLVSEPGELVHRLANAAFDPNWIERGMFDHLRSTLEYNLIVASGGNPRDPSAFSKQPKYAKASDIKNPREIVSSYLSNTPLAAVFDQTVRFTLPNKRRFEHHHIVAGSGHGKTQTLQYLIANDLQAVRDGDRSVVVLDSQGDLIRNISSLAVFAPGGELHDRIVIIDPTDVEYPVSLNLFDVGQDRLSGYLPLEQERLTNSILELYDFVLGSLLEAQMTQKQAVIFRYVTRLMLHIPDATIHTLRELMEPQSELKFADHIAKLSGTARHFFETEFAGREFEQTKKQVLRRLWGILENQTFERMFSHPRSKLDLFGEMNSGKIILINTAKDLLKESGTEIFGRFFIALIAQAAQERAVLPQSQRTPTFVYIDEAADYFDRNIGLILSQARKYRVGMILAHQYLGQLNPALQEAFAANTSIKFAGGVSAKDARQMAQSMYCEPSLIEQQRTMSFASYVRGSTPQAVPLHFPSGFLEDMPRMSWEERDALQEVMRQRHAVHYSRLEGAFTSEGEIQKAPDPTKDPNEPTPYW